MSRKVPKKGKHIPVSEQTQDDPWRSGRPRWGSHSLRRGHDRRWHFPGQQADEVIKRIVRKHWIFLVIPALPFLGSLTALFIVALAGTALPDFHTLWLLIGVVLVIICLVAGGWFVYRDFVLWWLETYIITNKRIINSRGLLQPTRQETPLERVTQIGIDVRTLLAFFFSYGTVHVYLTGGQLLMQDVPHPKEVKDAILGISDELKAGKTVLNEKPLVPHDPEIATVLTSLAKGKDLPMLPDADAKYPAHNPDRALGPRRTFGGILRIPCGTRYSSGEFTVMYIQRSLYVLYRNLAIPVLLLLVFLPITIFVPSLKMITGSSLPLWWLIVSVVIVGLLLVMALVYTNYVDDVYILTNKRIIDIERHLIFLFESRVETEYKNIRDIKVSVSNILERLLDVGNVYIETPGSSPDIVLYNVDHPFLLQDKIYGIKAQKDQADDINKTNATKDELYRWFSKVVTTLEDTMHGEGAPDLQRMDIVSAMERAAEHDLHLAVKGEDPSPYVEPGVVIYQNPPPGTLMQHGGEVQIILSRRPTPADTF